MATPATTGTATIGRATIVWRFAVVVLLAAAVPLGIYAYEAHRRVDTEAMLDVSVSVRTVSHVTTDRFGDSVWSTGSGSGFLVSAAPCEVWTNQHVVEDAAIVEVFPRDWRGASGIPATVVRGTPHHDLAVLRLARCDGIGPARFGDSDRVRPGDDTYAVGNPLGRNPDSISRGIISHIERYVDSSIPYLQTDAAISPGNSGGALFNRGGEVIGMSSAIAATRDGRGVGGIGYAIPVNLMRRVLRDLERGPPAWGDAGIIELLSGLTSDEAAVFGVPDGMGGVTLAAAPTEGPAAGKLAPRDVIFRIDGAEVPNVAAARRAFENRKPGEVAHLQIVRGGEPELVEIELANGWESKPPPGPEFYPGHLGMTLEMWPDAVEGRGGYGSPVITRVQSLGPAHRSLIASSQHTVLARGPFVVPFQLDVKTVSGVVYRGAYHPIDTIERLDDFALAAYRSGDPLLLEIQLWRRRNVEDVALPLTHHGTAFYKIEPAPTAALGRFDDDLVAQVVDGEAVNQ